MFEVKDEQANVGFQMEMSFGIKIWSVDLGWNMLEQVTLSVFLNLIFGRRISFMFWIIIGRISRPT